MEFYLALVLNMPAGAGGGPPPQRYHYQYESERVCMMAREEYAQLSETTAAVCIRGRPTQWWDRLSDDEKQELILRALETLVAKPR